MVICTEGRRGDGASGRRGAARLRGRVRGAGAAAQPVREHAATDRAGPSVHFLGLSRGRHHSINYIMLISSSPFIVLDLDVGCFPKEAEAGCLCRFVM